MKLLPSIQVCSRRTLISAFTLVEIMTAMFVFVTFMVAGMVAVQIFVLRMNHFTTDKLLAAGGSSKAMDQICNQIRGAQFFWVGTFSTNGGGTFTPEKTVRRKWLKSTGHRLASLFHYKCDPLYNLLPEPGDRQSILRH